MNVNSIQAIGAISTGATPNVAGPSSSVDFGKTLAQAVQQLDGIQQSAADKASRLSAGESVDLHEVMIAQEWASLSLELAVQVRNKLVESYQEIMRMQV